MVKRPPPVLPIEPMRPVARPSREVELAMARHEGPLFAQLARVFGGAHASAMLRNILLRKWP